MMVDRVIETIDIMGGMLGLGFMVGLEVGKWRERKYWLQFRRRQ